MRRAGSRYLWISGIRRLDDVAALHELGIEAVVLLASEPIPPLGRTLIVCRIPLVDGADNEPWRIRLAIDTVEALVRSTVPTLVCCSNGMSRSVAVSAAALARLDSVALPQAITGLLGENGSDVSPGLWKSICGIGAAAES